MALPVLINPRIQFFDDNGNPLAGGKVYTYEANTSTPKATYTTSEGTTENSNPVVLDVRGESSIFLSGRYKIILKDSDDVQIWSEPDISLMPYTTIEQSEWIDQNLNLTYSSATVFTVPGDETATFLVGRRVKATVSAGTVYGVIKTSAYTTLTTVTLVMDSGSLDSGLSDISVGIITPSSTSFPGLYALPRYTTTIRDALTPAAGMVIYNTTTARVEAYYGSAWRQLVDSSTTGLTLTAPTIADFTNAAHDHGDADDGGGIVWQGLPDGAVVQVVNYSTGAYATGSTAIPYDDSIPQNTEGDERMTLAITPKATTDKLMIEVSGTFYSGGTDEIIMALFQDSTADALAAVYAHSVIGDNVTLSLKHYMAAGTTSATTFKIRAGRATAAALGFNGEGARKLGGVIASNITITEVKAS